MKLEGRTALVTGAAQGIGASIVGALVAEGATVASVDLQRVERRPGVIPFAFNLAQTSELPTLVEAVEAALGSIDILVNCAGICPTRPFLECDEVTWRAVFDINVHAPFFLIRAVAPGMIQRARGSIINLASISAFLPKVEQLDYGASKAALVSLTRSCAATLGPHGIRVNALAPGVIDTPLTQAIAQSRARLRGVTPEETQRSVIEATPLRRKGRAEEVAAAAVFLAADESSFVTGQTLDVCGGQLMR